MIMYEVSIVYYFVDCWTYEHTYFHVLHLKIISYLLCGGGNRHTCCSQPATDGEDNIIFLFWRPVIVSLVSYSVHAKCIPNIQMYKYYCIPALLERANTAQQRREWPQWRKINKNENKKRGVYLFFLFNTYNISIIIYILLYIINYDNDDGDDVYPRTSYVRKSRARKTQRSMCTRTASYQPAVGITLWRWLYGFPRPSRT